jgi:hypothetical protein
MAYFIIRELMFALSLFIVSGGKAKIIVVNFSAHLDQLGKH